jgi:hypothetical protein
MLIRLTFVAWIATITVLAIVPHADDGIMVTSNITPSGMEKHIGGYFLATLLFYYGYGRGAGRKAQGVRCLAQRRPSTISRSYGAGKGAKDRRKNDGIIKTEVSDQKLKKRIQKTEDFYIWWCGMVIFGYSVGLEFVQFFLPYRTFNPYDIVGNGIGVGVFCLIYLARRRRDAERQWSVVGGQRSEGETEKRN